MKAFVFLHDIDERRGRPTLVAKGSHDTFYYTYAAEGGFGLSRFNQTWVSENYKVVAMKGNRGGGFVFDTNALHRGLPDGDFSRDTIILEYHGYSKVPTLKAAQHDGPCPSKGFSDRREVAF